MATVELTGLITQVDRSVGVKASAKALIDGFAAAIKTAVDAALAADDAADQGSIDAANKAIAEVVEKLALSETELAAAIANHSTPPVA